MNPMPIKEIEKMKKEGTYGSPFFVPMNPNPVDEPADDEESKDEAEDEE